MKRKIQDTEARLADFFEEAYWLQRGECYPEVHEGNLEKLCRAFPWERHVIDALYRILPHFDYCMEEVAKKVSRGELTPDEGFQEIHLPVFYYIPESLKRKAWDLQLDNNFRRLNSANGCVVG